MSDTRAMRDIVWNRLFAGKKIISLFYNPVNGMTSYDIGMDVALAVLLPFLGKLS